MYLMGRMVKEFGIPFDLKYFLTTQSHDLEFYVQREKVGTVGTDWMKEAAAARNAALWPARMAGVPADGVLPRLAHSGDRGTLLASVSERIARRWRRWKQQAGWPTASMHHVAPWPLSISEFCTPTRRTR
jgi:hypothetical protein